MKIYNYKTIKLINSDFLKADINEKINLVITSPPYNLQIDYKSYKDNLQFSEYLKFTENWLSKIYELLADDGRVCINIPLDKNLNGREAIYADFVEIAKRIGFKYQTTIVWDKKNVSNRLAWGSFKSASAPSVIAPVEMVLVMYKKQWKRIDKGNSDITKEEFIKWTNGMWSIAPESAKRVGHPAPFPEELPKRCIKLFSYKEDTILDPFAGSGTTLIAGCKLKRKVIGVELDEEFFELAKKRIKKECYKYLSQNTLF